MANEELQKQPSKRAPRVGWYFVVLFLIAIAVLSFAIFLHVVLGAAGGTGFGGAWYK